MSSRVLSVVTWKWTPPKEYRSQFTANAVNVLRRMVSRNYPHPHRFICVTDEPQGLDPQIEVLPDWKDFANLSSPHGGKNPACYRRLRMFAPGIDKYFGKRFVSIDLDVVITADMTPIWNRPESFVIWGDTNPQTLYNGSMILMDANARTQVWNDFDPQRSPGVAKMAGNFGSDQAWISYRLGRGEARWTKRDGVYSFRNEIQRLGGRLPPDSRIVMFHGMHDPWSDVPMKLGWVRKHWC